jgi:hypothetical protein
MAADERSTLLQMLLREIQNRNKMRTSSLWDLILV